MEEDWAGDVKKKEEEKGEADVLRSGRALGPVAVHVGWEERQSTGTRTLRPSGRGRRVPKATGYSAPSIKAEEPTLR